MYMQLCIEGSAENMHKLRFFKNLHSTNDGIWGWRRIWIEITDKIRFSIQPLNNVNGGYPANLCGKMIPSH